MFYLYFKIIKFRLKSTIIKHHQLYLRNLRLLEAGRKSMGEHDYQDEAQLCVEPLTCRKFTWKMCFCKDPSQGPNLGSQIPENAIEHQIVTECSKFQSRKIVLNLSWDCDLRKMCLKIEQEFLANALLHYGKVSNSK
jgi:hypothetical protein